MMKNKRFVIVIPSYNNSQWYEKNLASVVNQNYPDYRIIYTDDASTDNTGNLVEEWVEKNNVENFQLIKNTERKGAMCNIYNMIHSCEDDEIWVLADGDDHLAHNDVLNRLNEVYQNPDIWFSYGSYFDYPGMTRGCAKPIPQHVIQQSSYRTHPWAFSHLRTG